MLASIQKLVLGFLLVLAQISAHETQHMSYHHMSPTKAENTTRPHRDVVNYTRSHHSAQSLASRLSKLLDMCSFLWCRA